jgi:hypothetical protein
LVAGLANLAVTIAMLYITHVPGPPLDAFVDNLWWLSDAPAHAREQILPSGTLKLVVAIGYVGTEGVAQLEDGGAGAHGAGLRQNIAR